MNIRIERPRVIVTGSINRDLVLLADSLPTAGETVRADRCLQMGGGKGANQAAAAAALGAEVFLIGSVGRDQDGAHLVEELAAGGVSTSTIHVSQSPTGLAAVVVDSSGENQICIAPGANDDVQAAQVSTEIGWLSERRATLLASLEVPLDAVLATAREASSRGWTFVLNPAPARELPQELLALTSVLVPNQHELAGLGATSVSELLEAGVGAVVVTGGATGSMIHRAGVDPLHVPSFVVPVVDTTGAGDCFCGALAVALERGDGLNDAVRFASAAAALSISAVGARAGLPNAAAVDVLLSEQSA